MEQTRRYLSIAFLVLTTVVGWVLILALEGSLALFGPGVDRVLFAGIQLSQVLGVVLAVGLGLYCWTNPRIFQWSYEVVEEVSKVTWPDKEDTQRSTLVVIAFAVVLAGCLVVFDFVGRGAIDLVFNLFSSL